MGKKGLPGINTDMAFNDYERIMGKEKVDEERQVAARKMSSKKGRWERKLDAIKSSLENFVPDVRPGQPDRAQDARASVRALHRAHAPPHPRAVGLRLPRGSRQQAGATIRSTIPNLWVNLEISVNPDGTLHKVTIAKTSGKTEFDVAAVDTVISAAPFEATPEAIRSVDGRVYLRWGFYRNWRQCGTFNVEPYILTEVPDDGGVGVLDDGAMVANIAKVPGKKKLRRADRRQAGDARRRPARSRRSIPTRRSTTSRRCSRRTCGSARSRPRQVDKLVKYSTVPFYAGGKVAAHDAGRPQGDVQRARRRVRSDEGLEAAVGERVLER